MANAHDPHTSDDRARHPGERIIDVSTGEPVVRDDQGQAPFIVGGSERIRVFAASGGGRGCAIPLVLMLLAACCGCIALWVLIDNFF